MISKIERVDDSFVDKINELIDAVNELEKQIDKMSCAILDLATPDGENKALKSIQVEPADLYAEQRKWIGKLCWYKLCEGDVWKVGRLEKIQENADAGYPFVFDGLCYKICEPVKPDDDIIYKGE